MEGKKYCKHCGQLIDEECVVCPLCGKQVEELKISANPNNIVINNNNSNTNNVVATAAASATAVANGGYMARPKSKWVAFILCFLFGYLGAHKFYEGKSGMGVLYLCTVGLFGIGWIVDLIVLLMKPDPYYV